MDHKVPAMIIQPLVENAITHGLEALPEGGCVSISAHYLRTKLEIIVEDNGSGMSSDTLRSLQYPVGDRNGGGILRIKAFKEINFQLQKLLSYKVPFLHTI